MKKLLQRIVCEAYWRLDCYHDDEHMPRYAVLFVPAAKGNDVVMAELKQVAAQQGAELGTVIRVPGRAS